ncbi:RDD family protein [Kineococcus endophyticus]|uniref:RDD family protein n=1 Tax=Kineococcus endophyticus TaxID=1181883 RepID=A0ABV3P774_9ACTN
MSTPAPPPVDDQAAPAVAPPAGEPVGLPVAGIVGEPVGEIVTGEAVVLGLRAASFASRILAAVLDAVLVGIVLLAAVVGSTSLLSDSSEATTAALGLSVTVLCLVGIPTAVETATRGRSVGKLVLGVRAVRDDGGPVRFRHCLVRAVTGFFELWALAGSPAIICSLVNARGKRLGDLLAGTYVVRERTAARHRPLPPMPPELAGWARSADIGRLPLATTTAARQFLARTGTLNPASREALRVQLADALLPHVSPAPPPGTDPERFLVAVLVERRDREHARMERRENRTRELERTIGRL